jgi:CubicO group peptidase (beta-lactamase class C family)
MRTSARVVYWLTALVFGLSLYSSGVLAQVDDSPDEATLGQGAVASAGRASYHNFSAELHSARAEEYKPNGFRLLTLSVSGDLQNPRYAAVWIKRDGPAWRLYDAVPLSQLQQTLDQERANGYIPTIFSAAGANGNEVFAIAFEAAGSRTAHYDFGLTPADFFKKRDAAFATGEIPSSIALYGSANDVRIAVTWVPNTQAVVWTAALLRGTSQVELTTALANAGQRPSLLALTPDGLLLVVYQDDHLPRENVRLNIVGADGYKASFDQLFPQGVKPMVVAAAGVGNRDTQLYAAVFAESDQATERTLQVTGDDFAASTDIDDVMAPLLIERGIRAAVVSVAKDGVVVGTRAYTYAEPWYPVTQPTTRFRLASLSKLFAAAEASALVAAGTLTWNTRAFELVGVTAPALPTQRVDPATSAITLDQLLLRTSRLPHHFDGTDRDIAERVQDSTLPLSRQSLLRYLYGMPLENSDYSNPAFYLVTSVVETATGLPFIDALNRDVLAPLGITDVSVGRTSIMARQADEVASYDAGGFNRSSLQLYTGNVPASLAYGGTFVLENSAGVGGLIASAPSVAKVIYHYPVWNTDAQHLSGYEVGVRFGDFAGTQTLAAARPDHVTFSVLINRSAGVDLGLLTTQLNATLDAHSSEL